MHKATCIHGNITSFANTPFICDEVIAAILREDFSEADLATSVVCHWLAEVELKAKATASPNRKKAGVS